MNDAILVTYGVTKAYRSGAKEVRAVDGVDLTIRRGKSTIILGPSGAGKSTLLHLLGGLDKPSSGSVLLDGLDIYKYPDDERAKIRNERIGFVFQFYHLLSEFTAIENVMLPGMIRARLRPPGDRENSLRGRAMEILCSVGLEARVNHRPGELSGGEQQRVAIARAMINEPSVLLCDEPTGNLDSKTSESIYKILFSMKTSFNAALVIVTHDESVSAMTDESIRLKDGRVC